MSNNLERSGILIGGIPAENFANRPIKVDFEDNRDCPCKCVGVDTRRDTVVVIANEKGRRISVHVDAKQCHPWWSKNPDLKLLADINGVTYEGEVSVGRALAEAIKPMSQQVEDRVGRYRPPAKRPVTNLSNGTPKWEDKVPIPPVKPAPVVAPEPKPAPEPEPVAAAPIPEPVVIAPPPVPEPVAAAPAPKPPVTHTARKLVGIEAPVDAPDSWVDDYREYKRIVASYEPARQEIERMREVIAKLEAEQEDNKLLLDLHVEQLEAAGVVLKWEYSQADSGKVSQRPPVDKPRAPIEGGLAMERFKEQLIRWLPGAPPTITFKLIFDGLEVKDNPTRRIVIKDTLASLGYQTVAAVAAAGYPAEFRKPTQPQ